MSQESVLSVLQKAVDKLVAGEFSDVRKQLDKPYKEAMAAETNAEMRNYAEGLYTNLWKASSDEAKHRLDTSRVHTEIQSLFSNGELNDTEKVKASMMALHSMIHEIDGVRALQAQAFTEREQQLLEEMGGGLIGRIRYGFDLIRRRWCGDHHADDQQPHAATNDNSVLNVSEINNEAFNSQLIIPDGTTVDIPETDIHSVTLDGKALEEFGNIEILHDGYQKAGAGFMVGAGGLLLIHGIRNVGASFQPDVDRHLQVETLGQRRPETGVNWSQLAVGVGEAAVGSALMYRFLTGRWGTDALEGHVERMFECNHSPVGHGYG